MKLRFRYVLIVIGAILLLGLANFMVWAAGGAAPMPEALNALDSTEQVIVVKESDWYAFFPAKQIPDVGFIFYPGGKVDERAYAPAAFEIAEQGYLVVIVNMPLKLAVFGINRALDVIDAYDDIETWVIGGHSLGGAMAARFVSSNPGVVEGLALWASYPADSDDLSDQNIDVISLYGDLDGLASTQEVEAGGARLPDATQWVMIEGGNHAQFGYYGEQDGDLIATISREEQQQIIIEAMIVFLE
jgi:hypothetical protein